MLQPLLEQVEGLLVGGGMANRCLKARRIEVGESPVGDEGLEEARRLGACWIARVRPWSCPGTRKGPMGFPSPSAPLRSFDATGGPPHLDKLVVRSRPLR